MFNQNKIQVVTPEQFPSLPKEMYALGNVELLNKKCIAVAGTRKIDGKSSDWLQTRISELQQDWVVVSGLALGSDTVAHKAAIDNGLGTIAVLPTGIERIAPRSNNALANRIVTDGGLLLSEYPSSAGLESIFQYKERNKVIADISNSLMVPQFDERSGTRSTVDFAQEQNKLIITQNANYSGNQYILNNKDYRTISL